MNKSKTINSYNRFFQSAFLHHVDKWISEGKKSGEKRNITVLQDQLGVSRQTLYNWRTGANKPDKDDLERIFNFFEVSEDEFFSIADFTNSLEKMHITFSRDLGLDLDFVKSLNRLIDFGESFPLYSHLWFSRPYVNDNGEVTAEAGRGEGPSKYIHDLPTLIDEDTGDILDYLQFEREGKNFTLRSADLAYLKEVQDKVIEYVQFLFYQRMQEMNHEADDLRRDVIATVHVGKTKTGGKSYSFERISNKEILIKNDRFAEYAYRFEDEEA